MVGMVAPASHRWLTSPSPRDAARAEWRGIGAVSSIRAVTVTTEPTGP